MYVYTKNFDIKFLRSDRLRFKSYLTYGAIVKILRVFSRF